MSDTESRRGGRWAEEPTVTVDAAAALLGMSRHGTYNAIREGTCRAFALGAASGSLQSHCARCSALRIHPHIAKGRPLRRAAERGSLGP